MFEPSIQTVLSRYPALGTIQAVTRLRGGFSRDETWKISGEFPRVWVLKRIPATAHNRRHWQSLLPVLELTNSPFLPQPLPAASGHFIDDSDDLLSVVLTWMPGEPLLAAGPTLDRLLAAVTALAQVHTMLAGYAAAVGEPRDGVPPGVRERHDLLRDTLSGIQELASVVQRATGEFQDFGVRTLGRLSRFGPELLHTLEALIAKCRLEQPKVFPCLRDVRPEHVMFVERQGDEAVAGFIDVGAMRRDSPAADVARLTQRWRLRRPEWFATAIEAYARIRPVSDCERELIVGYDRASRLLSCVNWLRWLLIDGTEFSDGHSVSTRLHELDTLCVEAFGA